MSIGDPFDYDDDEDDDDLAPSDEEYELMDMMPDALDDIGSEEELEDTYDPTDLMNYG